MNELQAFERELADLEKITGLSIGDGSTAENYVLSIKSKEIKRVIRSTWNAPEPFKLGLIDKYYLCSLGMYGWYEVIKYLGWFS